MLVAVELFAAVKEFVAPGLLNEVASAGIVLPAGGLPNVLLVTCSAGFSSETPTLNASLNFSTKRIWATRNQEKPGRYCPSIVCGMFSLRTPSPTFSAVIRLQV